MVSAKTTIVNEQGMHMRPAQVFVTKMSAFPCEISLISGEKNANGKSIMSLMAACLKKGTDVEIRCNGEREDEALAAALELIASGLGD